MFEKIRSFLKRKSTNKIHPGQSDKEMITNLMSMLKSTREEELSCDEVYELIDQYAELIIKGDHAEQVMPLIKHHLDMCKDCNEEYDSLLSILNAETA
jgi:hypothetical protein